ncbi:MAG TPA: carboxylesterase/lipase family protein [Polyangiaceae bacterium]|nr:carboxylesterase/lipase family protein [Polyangiaceae bacterium]
MIPTKRAWISFAGAALFAVAMTACSSSGAQPGGTNDAAPSDGAPSDAGLADGPPGDGSVPVVTVAQGQLQGRVDGKVFAYLGIPYAKPPVGPLRWKEPQPPASWSDVRDATAFGNRCAQNANPTLFTTASADEDCLYLNVWTPDPSASKLPVMVWIHGGGNVGGSASDPVPFADGGGSFYGGATLASNHVVVVSLNYRLGVFGFFAHPGLVDEGSKAGNQGLWDQRFALQWVQSNVAKFGGDPSNVTIFGESAGSLDVCLHEASPQTPALFERAISESGGCTTRQPTLAEGRTLMQSFAAQVGCSDAGADASAEAGADSALSCMRNASVATLLSMASASDAGGMLGPFEPVVDGDFLADQPRTLYQNGKIAKTPYLLGSNQDEGTLFVLGQTPVTDQAGLTSYLDQQYGDASAAVAQLYPVSEFDGGVPNPYQAAVTRIVGDSILVCSTYDSALLAAAQGSPVYMYDFDIPVDIPGVVGTMSGELYLGASHGSELSFVFGSSPQFATDMAQASISQLMERYWTRFAAAGDPNGGSDLMWPKFSAMNDQRMQFTLMPSVVTGFRSAECMFWISRYEAQFAAGP